MSIADKLTKLDTDLTNSYDAVEEQGGTIPANKNTENLAPAIMSIPKGGGGVTAYTVTFNSDGGSEVASQQIVSGYTAKEPDTPTKDGYKLKCWTLNGVEYDFDTPVTSDITLVAVWDEIYEQLINYTMLYDGSLGDAELNECTEVTGGWGSTSIIDSDKTRVEPVKENDGLLIALPNTTYKHCVANTLKSIDFSSYSKHFIKYKITNAIKWGSITFRNSLSETTGGVAIIPLSNGNNNSGNGAVGEFSKVLDCDLESGYLIVWTAKQTNSDGNGAIKINEWAIFKPDDWTTLAERVGIEATSIDDILTNSTTLLSNEEAVKFMIYNCTGDFMASAIQSSTFLTALNNSKYKTIIMANEHWAKFLNMVV